MLLGQNPERNTLHLHQPQTCRGSAKTAPRCGKQPRLSSSMRRPGLLPQICPPIGLALLVATGLLTAALPILFVRLVVLVAVDGITWK